MLHNGQCFVWLFVTMEIYVVDVHVIIKDCKTIIVTWTILFLEVNKRFFSLAMTFRSAEVLLYNRLSELARHFR